MKSAKKNIHGVLKRPDRVLLKKILKDHVVYFKFVKKDGSTREAVGTLNHDYTPRLKGGSPRPIHQFVYYDLIKKHWRSFRTFSFLKIEDIKTIEEYERGDEENVEVKKVHKPVKLKKEERGEKDKDKDKEKEKKHLHKPDKHKEKEDEEDIEKEDETGED